MRRIRLFRFVLLICWGSVFASGAEPERVRFDRDIRPILSNHCFHCHGPDHESREADLRLDTREGLFAVLSNGQHLVSPGKSSESELFERVSTEDESLRMPPTDGGKPLSSEQIDLLKQWIQEGAEWRGHWAYEPIVRPELPEVSDSDWQTNPIDRFIKAKLERAGVSPVSRADDFTLLRRLSLDLSGIVPDEELRNDFSDLSSTDVYKQLVNRLFESPRYGERMAVYWLDLVRYADSIGYHSDVEQNVSPYRDYVIQAFNRNIRFDQFTREQIAGDLLPNPTLDQRIATCFNRLSKSTEEGGAQEGEYLAKAFADRVRTVSGTWLGATFGCAECHDHKFDPISTKDFYRFGAFFADVREQGVYAPRDRKAPDLALPTPEQEVRLVELNTDLLKRKDELKALPAPLPTATETSKAPESGGKATSDEKKEGENPPPSSPVENPRKKELEAEIATLETELKSVEGQVRRVLVTESREPREIRILPRGDWLNKTGEVVTAGLPASFISETNGDHKLTRLDLANWLMDRNNPLTARVYVNRLWKIFFGSGLSRNLDDLGFQGESPTHPELLDWLSAEFIESGWDIQHLIRLIVTSRAYQLSSIPGEGVLIQDPQNRLLSHQSRWRLEAEFLRDNALFVSGLLVEKLGGPSVKPYQPAGYWEFLNFPKREWEVSKGEDQYRRGLYTHWQRTFLHPSLLAFDAPSREECTANRPNSNTPKAALALLNDPSYVEAARAFAAKTIQTAAESDSEKLRWAWVRAVSRPATEREIATLQELLNHSRKHYQENENAAIDLLKVGDSSGVGELNSSEVASWTTVCRAILNLHEFTTRN